MSREQIKYVKKTLHFNIFLNGCCVHFCLPYSQHCTSRLECHESFQCQSQIKSTKLQDRNKCFSTLMCKNSGYHGVWFCGFHEYWHVYLLVAVPGFKLCKTSSFLCSNFQWKCIHWTVKKADVILMTQWKWKSMNLILALISLCGL